MPLEYARPIAQATPSRPPAQDTATGPSSELRRLLHRREIAAIRHRAALARKLGLSELEVLAVFYVVHHGELTQKELSELLSLSPGGTAALVQRLEDEGHVIRRRGEADRRQRLVRPSRATAEVTAVFYAPLVQALDELTRAAGERLSQAIAVLEGVAAVSEQHADSAAPAPKRARSVLMPCRWG